jgi:hypothetical protein
MINCEVPQCLQFLGIILAVVRQCDVMLAQGCLRTMMCVAYHDVRRIM